VIGTEGSRISVESRELVVVRRRLKGEKSARLAATISLRRPYLFAWYVIFLLALDDERAGERFDGERVERSVEVVDRPTLVSPLEYGQ
jgi:hypothetical protein